MRTAGLRIRSHLWRMAEGERYHSGNLSSPSMSAFDMSHLAGLQKPSHQQQQAFAETAMSSDEQGSKFQSMTSLGLGAGLDWKRRE
jgi:hypothetical protein